MPRYYRRWPYRSWRRYSGTTSAQMSGRRYFNISFPVENILSLTVPASKMFTNVVRTTPFCSPVGTGDTDQNRALYCCGLVGSLAYRKYCDLYDQVKINSVSYTVCIASTVGEGGIPGLRAYTSWDRDYQNAEPIMTVDNLINGPEAQVVTFINNSRAKFTRFNRASDLQERTTFVDSTNRYTENQYWANDQWSRNLLTSGGYHPSMSMVLQTSNSVDASRTITIQVQARYNVTFRNPKFGMSVEGSAKAGFSDTKEVVEEAKREMTEDEKFDEIVERVVKKMKEGDGDVVVVKREKDELLDDEAEEDDDEMESQKEPTREELLEMLAKYKKES